MTHKVTPPNLDPQIDRVVKVLATRKDLYTLAVVGIPGSGKSTFCKALSDRLPDSVVLPMDGYHLPRRMLKLDEMKRRGAPHTFDLFKLRNDLTNLRRNRTGSFPAFDHATKDPEPEAIRVTCDISTIIVEGNYLLLKAWKLEELFDFKIFLDCDIQIAMDRVQERLVECKIVSTRDEAARQVHANDFLNANLVLNDGAKAQADLVLRV